MENSQDGKHRGTSITYVQKDMLIEFIKQNENLQSGKFTVDFTFKKAKNLWEEVSTSLNSIPGGAKKDWKHWRKTWQDLKKNVKSKAVKEKKYSCGTGGGPLSTIQLDNADKFILEMVSPKVIFGDPAVKLPKINFEFTGNNEACSTPNNVEQTTPQDIIIADVSISDEFAETYTADLDHAYNLKPVNTKPMKKITKTRRLENSIKISQQLVKIEEEKKSIVENFYQEKTNYLIHRKIYEKEKLETLKKANFVQEEILKELRILKPYFM